VKSANGTHNITCEWRDGSSDDSVLKYDVWLVNGHPSSASNKPLDFDHQFSFEQQVCDHRLRPPPILPAEYSDKFFTLFIIIYDHIPQDLFLYLLLIIFYIILTSAQLYAFTSQKIRNLLSYLFTISLSTHCLSYFFVGLHKIVFAHDGQGFEILNTVADIIRILSLVWYAYVL